MGQKTNPIGNRLGIIRGWDSNWYGGRKFEQKLVEDDKIYTFACVDYLFDRESCIYNKGENTEILQLLVRDVMIDALRELKNNGQNWLA